LFASLVLLMAAAKKEEKKAIKTALVGVQLKQRIRSPLFEHRFRRISILRVTSRRGTVGCYDTLAERYGERIRCFTLAPLVAGT
jgi:hypothetical protein